MTNIFAERPVAPRGQEHPDGTRLNRLDMAPPNNLLSGVQVCPRLCRDTSSTVEIPAATTKIRQTEQNKHGHVKGKYHRQVSTTTKIKRTRSAAKAVHPSSRRGRKNVYAP
ncbi:unnamed protein product, partial [Ectocarpus fasciculatus]